MKWEKRGRIFAPDGTSPWARHTACTPTPLLLDDCVRLYVGMRDDEGVSRIGYIDVEADDPSRVRRVSTEPVLSIGEPGAFDDRGTILGDVIRRGDELWMYYVGFQLVPGVKFCAFTGLAISRDGGDTFVRQTRVPLLDRAADARYVRAVHAVAPEGGGWRAWYASGDGWEMIAGRPYPRYEIRALDSDDGLNFPGGGDLCLAPEADEYRIGRPRVYDGGPGRLMFFTRGTRTGEYLMGYAKASGNGTWRRCDDIGLAPSSSGWDSESVCYPALLEYRDRVYMFYNGNGMGRTGVGYATLERW